MIGRFLSVDPLSNMEPSLTPYHYCSNNPINRVDPTGMQDEEDEEKKKKEKSWWEKLLDWLKKKFNPNKPPPTNVDLESEVKEVLDIVPGDDKKEDGPNIIINNQDGKNIPGKINDAKKLIKVVKTLDKVKDATNGIELSNHAKQRMTERNISEQSVGEAIKNGTASPGNKPNTTVYDLPANQSSNGRGVRVVTNSRTGKVITVIDKGRK